MADFLRTSDVVKVAPSGAALAVLTYAGSAWAPSAWTELVAAVGAEGALLRGVILRPAGVWGAGCTQEVDIGVGPAGSEAVIASVGLPKSAGGGYFVHPEAIFPIGIEIGAGQRVACRIRASAFFGSNNASAGILYQNLPLAGSLTTTSQPVKVAPSQAAVGVASAAVDWDYSAWVEIAASAAADWVLLGLKVHSTGVNSGGDLNAQIGVGGAGAETPIATWRQSCRFGPGSSDVLTLCPGFMPLEDAIHAGDRVAIRVKGDLDPTELNSYFTVLYLEAPL